MLGQQALPEWSSEMVDLLLETIYITIVSTHTRRLVWMLLRFLSLHTSHASIKHESETCDYNWRCRCELSSQALYFRIWSWGCRCPQQIEKSIIGLLKGQRVNSPQQARQQAPEQTPFTIVSIRETCDVWSGQRCLVSCLASCYMQLYF